MEKKLRVLKWTVVMIISLCGLNANAGRDLGKEFVGVPDFELANPRYDSMTMTDASMRKIREQIAEEKLREYWDRRDKRQKQREQRKRTAKKVSLRKALGFFGVAGTVGLLSQQLSRVYDARAVIVSERDGKLKVSPTTETQAATLAAEVVRFD